MPSILVSSVKKTSDMKSGLPKPKTKLPEPKPITQSKIQPPNGSSGTKARLLHSSLPIPQLKKQLKVGSKTRQPDGSSNHKPALPSLIPPRLIVTSQEKNQGPEKTGGQREGDGEGLGRGPERWNGLKEETEVNQKIYTDWANHYLVKSGHQPLIKDLQQDLADGVLLAQVIQVVANEKIGDINGFPKTRTQMIENIEVCLGFLAAKGINIQGLHAEEIARGNLKSILSLFFSLSKYKQQQQQNVVKQAGQCDQPGNTGRTTLSSPRPTAAIQKTATVDTLTNPSLMTRGVKLSLIQRKASRLPAAITHAPSGVVSSSSSSSTSSSSCSAKDSQNFSNYDRPRAAWSHTERSVSPPPISVEPNLSPASLNSSCSSFPLPQQTSSTSSLPLSTSCLTNCTLTQSVLESSSYKAWKSKSRNAKHSASSSPLLSVKTDAVPSVSPPSQPLSLSLPQLHCHAPNQPREQSKNDDQKQPHIQVHLQNKPKTHFQNQTHIQTQTLSSLPKPQNPLQSKPPKQPQSKVLEVPPKVIAQKSMLEKLKLFNSKSASKSSCGVGSQGETQTRWDAAKKVKGDRKTEKKGDKKAEEEEKEKREERTEKGKGEEKWSQSLTSPVDEASATWCSPSAMTSSSPPSPPPPAPSLSSPKIALRNLGRALSTSRKSSMKQGEEDKSKPKEKAVSGAKDKDKTGSRDHRPGTKDRDMNTTKDKEYTREKNGSKEKEKGKCGSRWGSRRTSQSEPQGARQEGVGSEAEPANGTTNQTSSIDPKGSKTSGKETPNTSALSSKASPISNPNSSPHPSSAQSSIPKPVGSQAAPLGGRQGEAPASKAQSIHPGKLDGETETQTDRERESCSFGPCSMEISMEGPCLPVNAAANGQLQRTQKYSHPNTATVAPFIYRSQPDVSWAGLTEVDFIEGCSRKPAFSQSAHGSLEDLTGADPIEARRLRTVSNMANLRQNLQETMSSLRGTQLSHCTTSSGRTPSISGSCPCPTSPWQLAPMSRPPRLQAGDAPSVGSGYRGVQRLTNRDFSLEIGQCLKRQQPTGQERDTTEDVEVFSMETRGYSDHSVLGKTMRMDSLNTGDVTDRQIGVFSHHIAGLSQPDAMTSSVTSSAVRDALQPSPKGLSDYDSWDDSSSVSSGISDVFDPDDITISSVSSFVNTPSMICKAKPLKPQTDCEKPSAMDPCSAPYRSRSDMTDPLQHSSSSKKTPSIGQTGSWRRGMTAQVCVTSPGTKIPPNITMTTSSSSLKTQGTGKTDDAKVSERRFEGGQQGGRDTRRTGSGSSSARASTTKIPSAGQGRMMTLLTSSRASITSGSATLGKMPSVAQHPQPLGWQSSMDDSNLSETRPSLLQYRSLPRPRRNNANATGNLGNNSRISVQPTGVEVLARGSRINTTGCKPPSSNHKDKERGGGGQEDSRVAGSGESLPPQASPTLRRYGHLSPLRGEEHRDWLHSHIGGGVHESSVSSLSSPLGPRFTFCSQLGSPTAANQMNLSALRCGGVPNGLSNQEAGNCDAYRTSNMALDEKSRTISISGSLRDGLEEVSGSNLSLVSNTSSAYSTTEEKSQTEIRKLRRELDASQEKVSALTTQLSANAHLVAAFEQSLSNMTVRLQNLTTTAEQKDSELNDLRHTIEQLKKHNSESQAAMNTVMNTAEACTPVSEQGSPVSGSSEASMVRQPSTESVTSLTSITSHTSLSSLGSSNNDLHNYTNNAKKKKKNWPACAGNTGAKDDYVYELRSSFKQAFGKRTPPKTGSSQSDMGSSSLPSSSKLASNHKNQQSNTCLKAYYQQSHNVMKTQQQKSTSPTSPGLRSSHSSSLISECVSAEAETVMQLRSELRDKEMKLTDIRLEALSSAHHLDMLREAMTRMQGEMEALRQENVRLRTETQNQSQPLTNIRRNQQQHLNHNPYENQSQQESHSPAKPKSQQDSCSRGGGRGGQTPSQHSLSITDSTSLDMLLLDSAESSSRKEGSHVKVVVSLDHRCNKASQEGRQSQFLLGCIRVSGRTKWDVLDGVVRRLFKEYLLRVDPDGQLGLSTDSVLGYSIADLHRQPGRHTPELLPCGYLVGDSDTIAVCMRDSSLHCADSLVFETLVPLPIMQHYITQLQENGCIILSGASGTGKSFLALRLAEHIVKREGLEVRPGVIATFSIDGDNSQELQQFLCKLCDESECSTRLQVEKVLPLVVIVENLHHLPSLPADLLDGLLTSTPHCCPYIIGTMTSCCPNLLKHPSLVSWSNKEEPVKNFLARVLRRRLLEAELSSCSRNPELAKVADWLPAVWHHLNHFLGMRSSADVSIGPGLFLSCPMEVEASRVWFTDLWNYSVSPYCLEAATQLSDGRAEWEDPTDWVIDSWPWSSRPAHQDLLRLGPEDVGIHGFPWIGEDPLVSKLQRLKEVSNCYRSNSNHNDTAAESSPESAL